MNHRKWGSQQIPITDQLIIGLKHVSSSHPPLNAWLPVARNHKHFCTNSSLTSSQTFLMGREPWEKNHLNNQQKQQQLMA